jgi:hypothetical protein
VVSPAWGSSGDKDKQTTFRVDAVTEQKFEGTSLGDQIVFTSQLLKGDTEVGHQGGVCTVTSVERQEAQCIATYSPRRADHRPGADQPLPTSGRSMSHPARHEQHDDRRVNPPVAGDGLVAVRTRSPIR